MDNSPESVPRIWGDYYIGADGPQVLIVLESLESVDWIVEHVSRVSEREESWNVTKEAGVEVVGLDELKVVFDQSADELVLEPDEDSPSKLTLSLSRVGAEHFRLFMEPFRDGLPGHQYFADNPHGLPFLEISYGEGHQRQTT